MKLKIISNEKLIPKFFNEENKLITTEKFEQLILNDTAIKNEIAEDLMKCGAKLQDFIGKKRYEKAKNQEDNDLLYSTMANNLVNFYDSNIYIASGKEKQGLGKEKQEHRRKNGMLNKIFYSEKQWKGKSANEKSRSVAEKILKKADNYREILSVRISKMKDRLEKVFSIPGSALGK